MPSEPLDDENKGRMYLVPSKTGRSRCRFDPALRVVGVWE